MADEAHPQDPIAEPDEPEQPLRGPTWAKRELLDDATSEEETSGETSNAPGRRVADEKRRRTPRPADITDHAP